MVTILCHYRLKKSEINYLESLVNSGKAANKTDALRKCINYHKQNSGLLLEMPQQFTSIAYNFYNKGIPFIFGCLFMYFGFLRSWFFIPFLMIAIIPFIFQIEKHQNIIKIRGIGS